MNSISITLSALLLFVGCAVLRPSKPSANNMKEDAVYGWTLELLPTHPYYPYHISYKVTSYNIYTGICLLGMLNGHELTILSLEDEVLLARPQDTCLSYNSTLDSGYAYSYPVLPQEYMSQTSLPSGTYKLTGAFTDSYGNRQVSADTIYFVYDAAITYKFRYKRPWEELVQLTIAKPTVDQYVLIKFDNLSSDTLVIAECTRLEAGLTNSDYTKKFKNFDITQELFGNRAVAPMTVDSIIVTCDDLRRLTKKAEVYGLTWTFDYDYTEFIAGGCLVLCYR
jgi:hypothetical protein